MSAVRRHPRAGRGFAVRGPRRTRRAGRGFSLVELMVAMVIGLVLTAAITGVMRRSEGVRRMTTSLNEVSMNGTYLSYTLDRLLRSAGSGFSQARSAAWGCRLLVSRGGTQVLPSPSAFKAPFAAVPQTLRLAPLVVHAGLGAGGSDVLAVATGASALGESPLAVLPGSLNAADLRVPATVGLRAGDLVLVLADGSACMVQQLRAGFAGGASQLMEFGGTYAASTIAGVDLVSLGTVATGAKVAPLGNETGNRPDVQLLGIGANDTLFTLDLLQLDGASQPVPLSDGVVDLRARYGVDGNDDGIVDTWVTPADAGWTAAELMDGSAAAQQKIGRILAVRMGLILRNANRDRDPVTGDTLKLFESLGGALVHTRTLTTSEKSLRWRTLEFTVPLRNSMFKVG